MESYDRITVYEKPTCITCRKAVKYLIGNGVVFDKVNYYIEPFTKSKLRSLLKKLKMKPSELLRKKDKMYNELKLDKKNIPRVRFLI